MERILFVTQAHIGIGQVVGRNVGRSRLGEELRKPGAKVARIAGMLGCILERGKCFGGVTGKNLSLQEFVGGATEFSLLLVGLAEAEMSANELRIEIEGAL